jgi:hypothetical protein
MVSPGLLNQKLGNPSWLPPSATYFQFLSFLSLQYFCRWPTSLNSISSRCYFNPDYCQQFIIHSPYIFSLLCTKHWKSSIKTVGEPILQEQSWDALKCSLGYDLFSNHRCFEKFPMLGGCCIYFNDWQLSLLVWGDLKCMTLCLAKNLFPILGLLPKEIPLISTLVSLFKMEWFCRRLWEVSWLLWSKNSMHEN